MKAENNKSFSIKKGCESPLTVFADKEKIRQVLLTWLKTQSNTENTAAYYCQHV